MNYEALSAELVRAIRGSRSQVAFSRRLGYASNVLYTWESGRRWPTASSFLAAAARAGLPVDDRLREFAGPPGWPDDVSVASPAGVAALLRTLRGSTPIVGVAERAGRSRFAVARWLKGQAEPRLPDLLRMVSATSLRLLDFVGRLVDPAGLPSARAAWRRLQSARALAWRSPWAQAVLLGLELADYQALPAHDDAWLARRLGLDVDEVASAVQHLLDAGQVARRGPHLAPVATQAVDVGRPAAGSALKQHWARVGLDHLAHDREGVWSYNVFTVSDADLARIEELQRAHYRAVRALIARSEPAERVVLLNLQLVPLDRPEAPTTSPSG